MIKLLIIADDFTGALDSGVQFAAQGADTYVAMKKEYDFLKEENEAEVLVLDAETRHLSPGEAYDVVYGIVQKACRAGIPYIYKKTDSALRGNIGSELAAVMDAAGIDSIPFVPAYPRIHRMTREGIHYIEGIPVAESIFGKDPFEPVQVSDVRELISVQTEKNIVLHRMGEDKQIRKAGIHVYDGQTEEDLKEIGDILGARGLGFSSGCAGFAGALAKVLEFRGRSAGIPKLQMPLLVACGSMNPVTIRQIREAAKKGFPHIHLTPQQKLEWGWMEEKSGDETVRSWAALIRRSRCCIIDANDPEGSSLTDQYIKEHRMKTEEARIDISVGIGFLVKRLLDLGLDATLLCTGGDTLLALIRVLDISELVILCEIQPGVVLSEFYYKGKSHYMITKSGGIGARDLINTLVSMMEEEKEEKDVC